MSFTQGQQPGALPAAELASLVSTLQQTNQVATAILASLNSGRAPADYFHISGAGTFLVSAAPLTLLSLNINQLGTGGTGTIYNAAGTGAVAGTLEVAILNFGTKAPTEVQLGPLGRGFALNGGLVIITTGDADTTWGSIT